MHNWLQWGRKCLFGYQSHWAEGLSSLNYQLLMMKHSKNSQVKNYLRLCKELSDCRDPEIKKNLEERARERFNDLMPSFSDNDIYLNEIEWSKHCNNSLRLENKSAKEDLKCRRQACNWNDIVSSRWRDCFDTQVIPKHLRHGFCN